MHSSRTPLTCSCCTHLRRADLDRQLVTNEATIGKIASDFELSVDELLRHQRDHLPRLVTLRAGDISQLNERPGGTPDPEHGGLASPLLRQAPRRQGRRDIDTIIASYPRKLTAEEMAQHIFRLGNEQYELASAGGNLPSRDTVGCLRVMANVLSPLFKSEARAGQSHGTFSVLQCYPPAPETPGEEVAYKQITQISPAGRMLMREGFQNFGKLMELEATIRDECLARGETPFGPGGMMVVGPFQLALGDCMRMEDGYAIATGN
jgi:hypothetical protein